MTELRTRILNDADKENYRSAGEYLLGAILIDASDADDNRETINRIAQVVQPSDFPGYKQGYGVAGWQCREARIFSAMISCPGAPHVSNVFTELTSRQLSKPGDAAFLVHCTAVCPTSYDADDYAVAVRYYSQLRNSVESGGPHLEHKRRYTGLAL